MQDSALCLKMREPFLSGNWTNEISPPPLDRFATPQKNILCSFLFACPV